MTPLDASIISSVEECPYSVDRRLHLARQYASLGYPDLAAGEAYMALLLIDEIRDEYGEYHEQAVETTAVDLGVEPDSIQHIIEWSSGPIEKDTYAILAENLLLCDNLRSAYDFIVRRYNPKHPDDRLEDLEQRLNERLAQYFKKRGIEYSGDLPIEDYPDRGFVRRELYPWNNHEPNRFLEESIDHLNEQLRTVAPDVEVKMIELPDLSKSASTTIKQLGLFAKRDIEPEETILHETSLLTATRRLNDAFCDACSAALPSLQELAGTESTVASCPECEEAVFCSETCLELAQESYHPAVCGADISSISKDAPAEDMADALYSLLLLRALAMAVTQELNPLDLQEVKFIWGDYTNNRVDAEYSMSKDPFHGFPRTLPFSFHLNVLLPIHMLEKMDVNIFTTSHLYAPWVTNTLYAKFRGTASARQGLDGKPEVSAVHPLWCLANHSCDPNVAWEKQGSIKFWVRKERVKWKGKEERSSAGIRKGDELLSHYCDIELPVKERREWAMGALGGECRCNRCIWEETQN